MHIPANNIANNLALNAYISPCFIFLGRLELEVALALELGVSRFEPARQQDYVMNRGY